MAPWMPTMDRRFLRKYAAISQAFIRPTAGSLSGIRHCPWLCRYGFEFGRSVPEAFSPEQHRGFSFLRYGVAGDVQMFDEFDVWLVMALKQDGLLSVHNFESERQAPQSRVFGFCVRDYFVEALAGDMVEYEICTVSDHVNIAPSRS